MTTFSRCGRRYAWRNLGKKLGVEVLTVGTVVATMVPMTNTNENLEITTPQGVTLAAYKEWNKAGTKATVKVFADHVQTAKFGGNRANRCQYVIVVVRAKDNAVCEMGLRSDYGQAMSEVHSFMQSKVYGDTVYPGYASWGCALPIQDTQQS